MRIFAFFSISLRHISHNNSFITPEYIHLKMNIKTSLLEEHVNFFDNPRNKINFLKQV